MTGNVQWIQSVRSIFLYDSLKHSLQHKCPAPYARNTHRNACRSSQKLSVIFVPTATETTTCRQILLVVLTPLVLWVSCVYQVLTTLPSSSRISCVPQLGTMYGIYKLEEPTTREAVVNWRTKLWREHNTWRKFMKQIPERNRCITALAHIKSQNFSNILTYILTALSRVLLEKLTGSQLVKKFPAFYGAQRFITAFTSARHLSLSWARSIQSMPPHPAS